MRTDVLRLAGERDAPAIAEIYAPSVLTSVTSFELVAPGPDEMATRIARILGHAPWLVLVRDHEVVGYAYASRHRDPAAYQWSVNTSVYVRADQKRTGTGRTLYGVLLDLLRIQGFYSAHAGIALPNDASVGLHEAMGFAPIGVYRAVGFKAGEWRDVGWWQLALRPRIGAPEPPLSMQAAQARADWSAALRNASEP
jgi:L-amino acid N-acyltransferase YncA